MYIAIFFVIRLKNSRSMISIPMNKNLFPGDFFFQVSLNVFLHCCVQWDFFSTCIFDQVMTLLPTITQLLMPWLSSKRNPYSACPLWTFWGGKLLMDFKITFKRDGNGWSQEFSVKILQIASSSTVLLFSTQMNVSWQKESLISINVT